jgi:anti-sigma regulatory factor (Ser/Thr protein kinase)
VRHSPLTTHLVVSAQSRSARSARAAVHGLCVDAETGAGTADVAALLTSELVTNAHEHAGGRAVLDAFVDDRCVRVDVADGDATLPGPRAIDLEAERGRGLLMVAAFASRWGARPTTGGKTVWFELDLA